MQNETIICVAPRDWFGLWKEAQSIMSRLAEKNQVLYFDPGRDSQKSVLLELLDNFPNYLVFRKQEVKKNLTVISTPSSLPLIRRYLPHAVLKITMPIAVKYNSRILINKIRKTMKILGVKTPILWLYSPYHVDLIGKFNEKMVCYYNYDEFSAFLHNNRIKEIC